VLSIIRGTRVHACTWKSANDRDRASYHPHDRAQRGTAGSARSTAAIVRQVLSLRPFSPLVCRARYVSTTA
jgi:hypothetical protein